jgi:ATP-binding cassette, subfamily G (WHITE), member 4
MRLVVHVVVAILVGFLYWQIGDDAAAIFNNVGMIFFNMLFIMAAAMMPTVLTCQSKQILKIIERFLINYFPHHSCAGHGSTDPRAFESMV